MPNLKQSEKFALVRETAIGQLNLPDNAKLVKVNTYAFETPYGVAKVAISATKGDFDIEAEAEAYRLQPEVAEAKAQARAEAAEAKRRK